MDDATPFPPDLLAAERARQAAYQALANNPERTTVLRRRLLRMSTDVWFHPHWTTCSSGAPAARVELRRRARGGGCGERTA